MAYCNVSGVFIVVGKPQPFIYPLIRRIMLGFMDTQALLPKDDKGNKPTPCG